MHIGGEKMDAATAWIPFTKWLSDFATSDERKVALTYGD
jgi:hypothetical protein